MQVITITINGRRYITDPATAGRLHTAAQVDDHECTGQHQLRRALLEARRTGKLKRHDA